MPGPDSANALTPSSPTHEINADSTNNNSINPIISILFILLQYLKKANILFNVMPMVRLCDTVQDTLALTFDLYKNHQ